MPANRHPVLQITLAALLVLFLAQALSGLLSYGALQRLDADLAAERAELALAKSAGTIDTGLRLGKPMAQYFGLQQILQQATEADDQILGLAVLLADGQLLAQAGILAAEPEHLAALSLEASRVLPENTQRRANGRIVQFQPQGIAVAAGLSDGKSAQGVLVLLAARPAASGADIGASLRLLGAITAVLALLLALGLGLAAKRLGARAFARLSFLLPLLALLAAQAAYSAYTIQGFRGLSADLMRSNARAIASGLQTDLNRVLALGIPITKLHGVEAPLARLHASFPLIKRLELSNAQGQILATEPRGVLHTPATPADATTINDSDLQLDLRACAACPVAGQLHLYLDDELVATGVRERVLDALTIALVSLVCALELLLLVNHLLQRPSGAGSQPLASGRVGRAVIFGFLFAWALPLGFLPIFARGLAPRWLDLPPDLLLALPISAEMACGLFTALLAGHMVDRLGWRLPVFLGLFCCAFGFVLSAWAPDLPWFIAARCLVGLGYGLSWMGLQGFVVTVSARASRASNISQLIAGLFAGHMAGAAVGAMLMQQIGSRPVFLFGAVVLLAPAALIIYLRHAFGGTANTSVTTSRAASASSPANTSSPGLLRLLILRPFALLLLGSIIPFSIAQVGLLSYALPLYLEAQGETAASTGRVLMLYGLCVIYIGPLLGHFADRSKTLKPWIICAGVVGSLGLIGLYAYSGVLAATLAVLLLALASCLATAAQTPYMLALPQVQSYGAAAATSIMRAADKLGQMLGPLLVGALLASLGLSQGLAITGLFYLGATLAFAALAPREHSP